ncbi:unnamed protein product [Ranitomeya imitator]|uniref:TCP1 n=1 Tax=Ranitomeya imitator TaxID=111125 RepID=A0ABN9LUB7_9NEOB|nr:unnamed protein product [Ranitomeya imitator]
MSTACTATPYPHRSLSRTKILAHKCAQKSGPGSVPHPLAYQSLSVAETRTSISSLDVSFLFSTKARTCASIILRGANDFMCDEMERSVHDALCVVKRVLESKSVVPGGGAVEAALSIYLENYATSMDITFSDNFINC